MSSFNFWSKPLIFLSFCGSLAVHAEPFSGRGSNSLSLFGSQYISSSQPYFSQDAKAGSGDLSLRLSESLKFKDRILGQLDAEDAYVSSENWNYLNFYQAFVQYKIDGRNQVAVGRKLETWSTSEAEWSQGVFQPRYRINKLRSEDAGLTGVFTTHKYKNMGLTLGFLPIHLPEFGPHFYLADQKFTSKNPWFRPPPPDFIFRGRGGNIAYEVDRPSNEEVVFNPGFAGKFEYANSHYLGRIAYAYKPMTGFLLGFPSEDRVIVSETDDTMNLLATPRVIYHQVVGLDNEWRDGVWTLTSGLLFESPVPYASPTDWTTQEADPAYIATLSASRALETPGPGAAALTLGFYRLWGGDAPDRGVFATANSLFERRFMYNEAYSIGLKKEFRNLFGKRLETQARFIYDHLQEGVVFSFDSALAFNKNWRAEFEFDLLGLTGVQPEIRDGFLATYRANDRVGLGMTYVF